MQISWRIHDKAPKPFERTDRLGPLVCAGRVNVSGAVFGTPVTLSIVARRLECRRTRWSSTADVRLRYATVDFAHAVFEYPLTIAAESEPFTLPDGQQMAEAPLAGAPSAGVWVASLRGVDAAHLVLADVDLSGCLFNGAVHWTRCAWRVRQPGTVRGWNVAVGGAGHVGPAQLAPIYRALREEFEDGKNKPGAADFYYDEMEMRRHDVAAPAAPNAACCTATGCCPATAYAPPGRWAGSPQPCSSPACC